MSGDAPAPPAGETAGADPAVLSVDEVERAASYLTGSGPDREKLLGLAGNDAFVAIESLTAGYGKMEVLHSVDLFVKAGQSLCLIGPNGAGKSTVLHSIYGFTDIRAGRIAIGGHEVTRLSPNAKLKSAGVAYVLQDNSVFPDMTVFENLLMGGYLLHDTRRAHAAAERVLEKYPGLRERRDKRAGVLSGGERRLLEISRALMMDPDVLLVDEPSIGLEPRFIDMVFEILAGLRDAEGKTIIMVEQNAKKGLQFADIGYVLVSGQIAKAGSGQALLDDPDVGRLFLGG